MEITKNDSNDTEGSLNSCCVRANIVLRTASNTEPSNTKLNQTSIINISSLRLTREHISLLSKSLKFNITGDLNDCSVTQFRIDIGLFVQKIKNIDFHAHIKNKNGDCDHMAESADMPIAKNKQDRRTKTYNSQIILANWKLISLITSTMSGKS